MNSIDRFRGHPRREAEVPGLSDTASEPAAGRLDRAVPRAFWRMLQIGERAGLLNDVHRAPLLELFVAPALPSRLDRVLRAFEIDRPQLYALVTLFSADPHSVQASVLARECLCDHGAVGALLDRLESQEIVARESNARNACDRVMLTELGRETAVYAIYRVINAAKEYVALSAPGLSGPHEETGNASGS